MNEPKTLPLWRHAYAAVKDQGLGDYGQVVPWSVVLEALGMSASARDTWDFRQEYLNLRQAFESEDGLLSTERGMNGEGFRFLSREEMAGVVRDREIRKANDSLRKSLCLSKVPREGMESRDARSLDHWEEKTAWVGAAMKALLRKRKLLGNPKDLVKRLGSGE